MGAPLGTVQALPVTPRQKSRVKHIYTLFPKINGGQWQELSLLFLGSIGLKWTQL